MEETGVILRPKEIKRTLRYMGEPAVCIDIVYPYLESQRFLQATKRLNGLYHARALVTDSYFEARLYPAAKENWDYAKANGYPFHTYEGALQFTGAMNFNCTLSLYFDRYEYEGGAHGTTLRTSDSWNLQNNGRRILLGELFPDGSNYTRTIKDAVIARIARQNAEGTGAYFPDYAKLVEQTFKPEQFYLTDGALAVYFQQYDIAPYSSGIPVFRLPYGSVGAKRPDCE